MWQRILVLAGVMGIANTELRSQESPGRRCYGPAEYVVSRQASEWAARFAPILRFSDAETYYPTLPFFAAFDGVDNDGTNPFMDFADPEEISPGEATPDQVDWGQVHRWYVGLGAKSTASPGMTPDVIHPGDSLRSEEVARELEQRHVRLGASAITYRVCQLDQSESQAVWRYLRSDEQAWRRFRSLDLGSKDLRMRTRFLVVEYHLYYLLDAGLQGHPNDMEGVFVLQMLDLNETGDRQWDGKPVMVIGAGHSALTPNSIQVLVPADVSSLKWVRGFQKPSARETSSAFVSDGYLNVLVEFGGHSSAPDIDPYGSFTAGVDVNWHLDDVWGIRDVQAVAGTGFHGHFVYDMEFPRSGSAPVAVPPGLNCAVFRASACSPYALVAVADIRRLLEMAADTGRVSNEAFRDFVDATFTGVFPDFVGFREDASESAIVGVRLAFTRWHDGFAIGGSPFSQSRYLPWLGSKARSLVSDQLKLYLFRPASKGISTFGDVLRLINYGVRYETGDRLEPYLGFIVPAFASDFLPMRLPGFVELQVGQYRSVKTSSLAHVISFSALWEHRYVGNVPVSHYQRISWIPHRENALGDPNAANGSLAAGVSLVIPTKKRKTPLDLVNAIRLRTGLRIDLGHWDDLFRDAGFEFSISFRQ